MAASTASSAAVPDEAQSTRSTSGCVATATSPSGPRRRASRRRTPASSAGRSIRARLGRHRRRPAGDSARPARRAASAFSPAASATTRSRSGCASTTASALCPIEPVDPRMAIALHAAARLTGSSSSDDVDRPARRTAAVDAIEHAAVAGNQRRAVLHAGAALEHRLEQIADDAERHDRTAPTSARAPSGTTGSHQAADDAPSRPRRTRSRRSRLRRSSSG